MYGPHVSKTSRNLNGFMIFEPEIKNTPVRQKIQHDFFYTFKAEIQDIEEANVILSASEDFSEIKLSNISTWKWVQTGRKRHRFSKCVIQINNPVKPVGILHSFSAARQLNPSNCPYGGCVFVIFVFQYASAQDKRNVFHLLQTQTQYSAFLCNCVGSPEGALNVASVGWGMPTCFNLGVQDGLWSERQQADDVANGAVGLFGKVFS